MAFPHAVAEAAVGKLHDDEQAILQRVVHLRGEEEGMAQSLDGFKGLKLALGGVVVDGAEDAFDGDLDASGGFGAPDFAIAAAAELAMQPVAALDGEDVARQAWSRGLAGIRRHRRNGHAHGRQVLLNQQPQPIELQREAAFVLGQRRRTAALMADPVFLQD